MTALHWAVLAGQPQHARLLLRAGCNATAADTCGRTGLSLAIASGNSACIGAILPALREPRTWRDAYGRSPLHLASGIVAYPVF